MLTQHHYSLRGKNGRFCVRQTVQVEGNFVYVVLPWLARRSTSPTLPSSTNGDRFQRGVCVFRCRRNWCRSCNKRRLCRSPGLAGSGRSSSLGVRRTAKPKGTDSLRRRQHWSRPGERRSARRAPSTKGSARIRRTPWTSACSGVKRGNERRRLGCCCCRCCASLFGNRDRVPAAGTRTPGFAREGWDWREEKGNAWVGCSSVASTNHQAAFCWK